MSIVSGDVLPEETTLAGWWARTKPAMKGVSGPPGAADIKCVKQGWGTLQFGRSCGKGRLCLGGRHYTYGLGTHADSVIRVSLPAPGKHLSAVAGVDWNPHTRPFNAGVVCGVATGGKEFYRSGRLTAHSPAAQVEADLRGATEFDLTVKAVDSIHRAHFDWVNVRLTLEDGSVFYLDRPHEFAREPAFSFKYGGEHSLGFLRRCVFDTESNEVEGGTLHCLKWLDHLTGLQVVCEMKELEGFPAVDWVLRMKNTGELATPLIEDVLVLDTSWDSNVEPVLHRSRGGNEFLKGGDDFSAVSDRMPPGSRFSMAPVGGKSSAGWMPFFNLQTGEEGVMGAVGWTGQWAFSARRGTGEDTRNTRLKAGMEKTHFVLYPGEEIRAPSMLLVFWQGTLMHSMNLFRRVMLAHYTPKEDGGPVLAPLCHPGWGGEPADVHIKQINDVDKHELKYDYYWVDAGWYGNMPGDGPNMEVDGVWYNRAGDWSVNRATHPKGLKPVSDAAHNAGWNFLLWIEPERAVQGKPVTEQHPEWFLADQDRFGQMLANLGIPEARRWVTETVAGLIKENGVQCYRQDFNFNPLGYWRNNDAPDRQGINEMKYVEGLYAFLDELLERFPGLLIDNCASGGCRLDIEMCKRSIPLWRSDAGCPGFILNIDQAQTQTYYLHRWLPVHGTGSGGRHNDDYYWRSHYSNSMSFHPGNPAEDTEWIRKTIAEFKRCRPFFYGDFYPLMGLQHDAERSTLSSKEAFIAYQFDRPDFGEGMAVAFRHEKSSVAAIDLKPLGLDPAASYEVEDIDRERTFVVSGEELTETGVRVDFSTTRESRLFFYRKAEVIPG